MLTTLRDVDAFVNTRLRARRKELGLSQTALGEKIRVTSQQVQKYESCTNGISAGCLYEIAKALSVPINYFFEGYGEQRAA